MPCSQWNDDWIAHLYDELGAEEMLQLQSHLEQCVSCSDELARLSECRDWISKSSTSVPASPRVIVLQAKRPASNVFGFASGLAAAAVIFAVGVIVGPRVLPTVTTSPAELNLAAHVVPTDPVGTVGTVENAGQTNFVTLDSLEKALNSHQQSVESRFSAYDNQLRTASRPATNPDQTWVSRHRLEEEVQAIQTAWNRQRALDLQAVFQELMLTEEATNSRIQEQMLAIRLQNDPRISEK